MSSPVDIASSAKMVKRTNRSVVEEPDAEQEERDRKGDRMDRRTGARRRPGVGEVRECEQPCGRVGAEVPATEPEDRKRTERDDERSARARARAARARRARAARGAPETDRRARRAERSGRPSRPASPRAGCRSPCSTPLAPCARGRSVLRGNSYSSSARSRTARLSTPPSRPTPRSTRRAHGHTADARGLRVHVPTRSPPGTVELLTPRSPRRCSGVRRCAREPSLRSPQTECDRDHRNAKRPRCLERRRVSAARRDDQGERYEPERAEPRLDERDDDEKECEVVRPHDWRQRERRCDRQDEGAPLVAAPSEDDDAGEETEPDRRARPRVLPVTGRPRSSPTM